VRAAELGERLDRSTAAHPEAEVGPDHHDAGVQGVDEDAPHELLGGLLAERAVEREHDGGVDPGLREPLHLLGVADEGWRARLGPEHAERMAVEGDDGRREAVTARHRLELCDHAAVPGVHAVELADRDGARAEVGRHRGEGVEEPHDYAAAASATTRRGRREYSQIMPSTGSTRGTKP
jgi:hypothetical protein